MTKINIFRPVNLFTTVAIIFVMVSMKNEFPLINPWENSNNPAFIVIGKSSNDSIAKGISVKNVNSIIVDNNNIKWFCTDAGIAKHTGNNTLDNWAVYTSDDGLIDNFVQSIPAIRMVTSGSG